MKRIDRFGDDTVTEARKLLDAGMEMLHSFSDDQRCLYCRKWRPQTDYDDECAALLRCALNIACTAPPPIRPADVADDNAPTA